MQAVLEVYATHDIDIRPHVLLALVLYKVVDQVIPFVASSSDVLQGALMWHPSVGVAAAQQ